MSLAAPRLFRWEYVKPYPQLIVADGKTVWVYEPDLQQATVRDQGSEAHGPGDAGMAVEQVPHRPGRDVRHATGGQRADGVVHRVEQGDV